MKSLYALVWLLLLVILSPIALSFISSFEPALDPISLVADCTEEESNEDKDGEEENETEIPEYLFVDSPANSFLACSFVKHEQGFFSLQNRFNDIPVPPPRS